LLSLNFSILIPSTTARRAKGSTPDAFAGRGFLFVGSSSKEERPISSPGGHNRERAPFSLCELFDRLLSPVPGGRRSMVSVVRDFPPHGLRHARRPSLEF